MVKGKEDILSRIEVIRSDRKTLSLRVLPDGSVQVRAPRAVSAAELREFVESHRSWIEKHRAVQAQRRENREALPRLTGTELRGLADRAVLAIPPRVAHYATLIGVSYGRITIRSQRTRWGSCSSKGNLNFNCLLMLAPPEVLDSVVVHELCHRKEMNHSPRFYAEVLRVFPEYHKWNRWLKENGAALMARLPQPE